MGNVMVLNDFTDFLKMKIKVDGKTGNLSNAVTVSKDKKNVVVEAKIDFSKRYLKYLTKKYMKKQQLRDYLRVVATNKNTYELRYLQLDNDGGEAEGFLINITEIFYLQRDLLRRIFIQILCL